VSAPRPSLALRALRVCAYALALAAIVHFGWGRRALWRTQLVDLGIGGDGLQYWSMAIHLEREHRVSLDGVTPTWVRLPGYPALLRLTTRPAASDTGATDPHAIQTRVDAWLRRAVRVNLVVDLGCGLAAFLLALALGAGPLSLLAPLSWAIQPWSTVVAVHPLSDPLATLLTTLCLAALAQAVRARSTALLALGGLAAGLCQYVRPDAILLAPALVAAGLLVHRGRPRALWGLVVWALVFAPWPLRNMVLFHAPHPLGAAGLDARGQQIDRSAAFAWMRTWCVGGETETVNVAWKLPGTALRFEDLPASAYDSAEEIAYLRRFFTDYAARGSHLDSDLSRRLQGLAASRRARHPLAYWVRLPLLRIALRLSAPREGYGLGTLPTLKRWPSQWIRFDRAVVAVGLEVLALLLVGRASRPVAAVLALWLACRCVLIGWLPAPEPRYFLEALPLLAALATGLLPAAAAALAAARAARRRLSPARPLG